MGTGIGDLRRPPYPLTTAWSMVSVEWRGGVRWKQMKKLVFMVTHGPQNPERATIPFVMAVTAQASAAEVLLGFQADGVALAKKGVAEGVHFPPFPPLKELMDTYRKAGGELYVCGPCLQSRNIAATDFVEGATQVNAATFVAEIMEATNSLVY